MAIYFDKEINTFYLESKNVTYAFRINECGFLQHLYYGERIAREDLHYATYLAYRGHGVNVADGERNQSLNVYQNECPTFGRSDYRESMLSFNFEGVRVGDLKYYGHTMYETKPNLEGMPSVKGGQTLAVTLCDELHGVRVVLFYTVFERLPVILRHAEIFNDGEKSFTIDRAFSCCVDMPDSDWEAISLPGAHLRERFMERKPLRHGVFSIDSKRGVSSGQMNPFLAIVRKNTDENQGEAYGYNLVYSGDFAFTMQIDEGEELRILGGLNDYDFSWELAPKGKFTTPEAVLVYSQEGLGGMSRAFHDLYRKNLINPRFVDTPHPIVINNWEATYFDFNTERLCAIVDSVQGTEIDTFVLDDGWFVG